MRGSRDLGTCDPCCEISDIYNIFRVLVRVRAPVTFVQVLHIYGRLKLEMNYLGRSFPCRITGSSCRRYSRDLVQGGLCGRYISNAKHLLESAPVKIITL